MPYPYSCACGLAWVPPFVSPVQVLGSSHGETRVSFQKAMVVWVTAVRADGYHLEQLYCPLFMYCTLFSLIHMVGSGLCPHAFYWMVVPALTPAVGVPATS